MPLEAYSATEIVRARQIHAAEGPKGTLWDERVRHRQDLDALVLLSDDDRLRFLEQAREEIRRLHAN
ncbi:hypothetical protein M446_1402 [Methylobacterium sp. 4-46]|uniref:hypothetical protein n=1 Tax=unclassified Methylobacterium TaxID=2615210 RepID=UPI000165C6DF|nr:MULTISPECIES: hypothetical protein [Methylobacterium]ACA15918.1 hypothetical protein M446_1402 [Methylobacterium sp. 4-46]WFT81635.1 hypothetical protein QA634_07115 [Methylobacterium nodulans]